MSRNSLKPRTDILETNVQEFKLRDVISEKDTEFVLISYWIRTRPPEVRSVVKHNKITPSNARRRPNQNI